MTDTVNSGGKPARASTRVQLELPEKSMERLLHLKELTEASSYAEVIKNSLRLYEAIISEVSSGKEIMLKDKDGKIGPYRIFV
jgi:hypothetical protein